MPSPGSHEDWFSSSDGSSGRIPTPPTPSITPGDSSNGSGNAGTEQAQANGSQPDDSQIQSAQARILNNNRQNTRLNDAHLLNRLRRLEAHYGTSRAGVDRLGAPAPHAHISNRLRRLEAQYGAAPASVDRLGTPTSIDRLGAPAPHAHISNRLRRLEAQYGAAPAGVHRLRTNAPPTPSVPPSAADGVDENTTAFTVPGLFDVVQEPVDWEGLPLSPPYRSTIPSLGGGLNNHVHTSLNTNPDISAPTIAELREYAIQFTRQPEFISELNDDGIRDLYRTGEVPPPPIAPSQGTTGPSGQQVNGSDYTGTLFQQAQPYWNRRSNSKAHRAVTSPAPASGLTSDPVAAQSLVQVYQAARNGNTTVSTGRCNDIGLDPVTIQDFVRGDQAANNGGTAAPTGGNNTETQISNNRAQPTNAKAANGARNATARAANAGIHIRRSLVINGSDYFNTDGVNGTEPAGNEIAGATVPFSTEPASRNPPAWTNGGLTRSQTDADGNRHGNDAPTAHHHLRSSPPLDLANETQPLTLAVSTNITVRGDNNVVCLDRSPEESNQLLVTVGAQALTGHNGQEIPLASSTGQPRRTLLDLEANWNIVGNDNFVGRMPVLSEAMRAIRRTFEARARAAANSKTGPGPVPQAPAADAQPGDKVDIKTEDDDDDDDDDVVYY